MVVGIIVIVALIGLVFTFQSQIKDAFADFRKPKTEQEVERMERGAVENTQAFILGEEGLANLKATSEANKIAIDKFISDSQRNIDLGIQGVNQTLVDSQKNLQKFAEESTETIAKNVNQFQKDVATNVSGIGEAIGQFGADVQTNVGIIGAGVSQFGADVQLNLQNIFGGQAKPKPVAVKIPTGVQAFSPIRPFTATQFTPSGVRISGIGTTPTPFPKIQPILDQIKSKEGVVLPPKDIVEPDLEMEAIKSRFTGIGSRR